jgi:hypothetical protein
MPAVVRRQVLRNGERMRVSFVEGGKHRSGFVRVPAAVFSMEIKPAAFRWDFCSGLIVGINPRIQTLDVVPGCQLQRDRHEIYERIDSVRKTAADLLVNTEDNAMVRCVDKPRPRISRTPHVNKKSLYYSLLRNSRSGHSGSFFQLPSSNGE